MAPVKKNPLDRLLARTRRNEQSGCLEWQGAKDGGGYGMFAYNGRTQRAHRISYELHVGPIPFGLCVCHRCDNRICVDPDHFFLGTKADNIADMDAKGRRAMPLGELHGCAKLTEDEVVAIRAASGGHGLLTDLARSYGVSRTQISNIRQGKNWSHV
jgi:hypothetical protein